MVKNAVKILDINNNLLGSGILLDGHVATVDHILNIETNYFIKINNNIYPAQVIYRSKDMATPVDIAMLSVNIHENYKPNVTEVSLNDSVEAKGFPQGGRYAIYPQGRHISGKVISFNYIDMTDKYPYCGNYITISSDEDITIGFSGAPVFVEDTLIGLVARKHIDDKPNNFNVVPIKYYLDANNGMFRNLFGEYNGFDKQNVLNKQIKSLINPFHFRSGSIDFVGRYDQIDQLFQFCSSSVSVQWWAITGVGGIGKSRLAYEFARSLNENVWDSIMLNTYDYESLKTKSTHIKKNTLIVLDYVQQNIRDIGKWLYTLTENETDHKVRVLLLERYGKSYRTAKWIERLNEKNCEYDVLVSMCYNPTMLLDPPFLVLPSLSKEDLVSITENYCKYNNALVESSTIQNIINQLDIIDPGYNRPLYLVFLIDAWIDNRDLLNWNKKFILESVLTREIHRIKLILRNFLNDDLLINAYLNVLIYSTIMDGLRYTDEFKVICGEELKVFQESTEYHRKDIMFFFSQMGFLTEDNDGVLIFEGLKPDLLGEYFIFNYDSNSTVVNNIIQRSLLFPERAFSFYHRLLVRCLNHI